MEWSDHGIILAINKYDEQSAIVSCLTKTRGLCRGFVKNTRGKNLAKSLFIGNIAHLSWGARLEQHLGAWRILSHETISPFFYHDHKKLTAVASICALVTSVLLEKEGSEDMFLEFCKFLYSLKSGDNWLKNLIFLELLLLKDIGYGLDVSCCVVNGSAENLIYISPKSGKAVSAEGGLAYKEKLFALPQFFIDPAQNDVSLEDLLYALNITKYFFEKFITAQNNLTIPKIRVMLHDVLKE